MQPLTPVSEVSEPPESPSPFMDSGVEAMPVEDDGPVDEVEEIEPPPAAVPFSKLFACADGFDWALMAMGSLAAAAHGAALVVYLHYFGKVINFLMYFEPLPSHMSHELFDDFKKVSKSFQDFPLTKEAVFGSIASWTSLKLMNLWCLILYTCGC